jgi:hypothetical protein
MIVFKISLSFLILLSSNFAFAGKGFSGERVDGTKAPPNIENINYPKEVVDKTTGLTITLTRGFDANSLETTSVSTIAFKEDGLPSRFTLEKYCVTDLVNEFLKSKGAPLRVHSFLRESSNTLMIKEQFWGITIGHNEFVQAILKDTKSGEKFNAMFSSVNVRDYSVSRLIKYKSVYKAQLSCGGLMGLESLKDEQGVNVELDGQCNETVCKNIL